MDVKNLFLFTLLFFISEHSLRGSEFTYADTVKLISKLPLHKHVLTSQWWNKQKEMSENFNGIILATTCCFLGIFNPWSAKYKKCKIYKNSMLETSPVIDSMKHNLWYNDINFVSSDEQLILEPVFFGIANSVLSSDFHSSNFMRRNQRIVTAAAVARGGSILLTEGINGFNTKNGKKFLKQASMHVGSEFAELYVVNPLVDKIVDNDDSLSSILKVGLNAAALYAFNSFVGK